MITVVDGLAEDGGLRPLQPLALVEHTQVRLSVETLPDDTDRAA